MANSYHADIGFMEESREGFSNLEKSRLKRLAIGSKKSHNIFAILQPNIASVRVISW